MAAARRPASEQADEEPAVVRQMLALERSMAAMTARQTAELVRGMRATVASLVTALREGVEEMRREEREEEEEEQRASHGGGSGAVQQQQQLLQLRAKQRQQQAAALGSFAAAVRAITEGLAPGSSPPLEEGAGAAAAAAEKKKNNKAAAAPKPLFPRGCGSGPSSADAFYLVREALGAALASASAALAPGRPRLARAMGEALGDVEEAGLFD